jgi:hypothetical protein
VTAPEDPQTAARRALDWVRSLGYGALAHASPGPARSELEDALTHASDCFDRLTRALEAGDRAGVYRGLSELMMLTVVIGAASRVLPENVTKMRAMSMAAVRAAKKAKDDERKAEDDKRDEEELLTAARDACNSLHRRPGGSTECVDQVRLSIEQALGRKIGIGKLKKALTKLRKEK